MTRASRGRPIDPLSKEADYDPQSAAISSAYVSLLNDYMRRDLKYGEGQTYLPDIQVWAPRTLGPQAQR